VHEGEFFTVRDGKLPVLRVQRPRFPIVEELREMLTYYRSLTDTPGGIIVPDVPEEGHREACEELAVTWLFRSRFERFEDLLAGPPT